MRDKNQRTNTVTGGIAALLCGAESIPSDWLEVLAKKNDIESLAQRLHDKLT